IPMPASEAKSPLASALGTATVSNETSIRITSDFRILLPSSPGFGLHHTTLRKRAQQMCERALDVVEVLRFERHFHHVLRIADLRVRAEQELRKHPQSFVQMLRDRPLALARVDDAEIKRVGREALADRQELRLKDLRDAGENVDVLDLQRRERERPPV